MINLKSFQVHEVPHRRMPNLITLSRGTGRANLAQLELPNTIRAQPTVAGGPRPTPRAGSKVRAGHSVGANCSESESPRLESDRDLLFPGVLSHLRVPRASGGSDSARPLLTGRGHAAPV